MISWNPFFHEEIGNPEIGAIVPNSDFFFFDIHLEKKIVHTAAAFSSDRTDLIVLLRLVTDQFGLQLLL